MLAVVFVIILSLLSPSYIEAANYQRIVSLAPSITEILFAMGVGEKVVGVTVFCDRPPEAKKRPKIGGMSNPSVEAILRLRPDIVIVTTDGNPEEVNIRLNKLGIKTYVFRARRIKELPQGIRELGRAIGEEIKANVLARRIEDSIREFGINREKKRALKALFIIWPQPLIVAGSDTAIDDAFEILGIENIARRAGSRYPRYSVEEIIRVSPDIIFIGVGMDPKSKNIKEFSEVLMKRLKDVKAVKEGRVYYVSDALYRLGPGVIKGIKELKEYIDE